MRVHKFGRIHKGENIWERKILGKTFSTNQKNSRHLTPENTLGKLKYLSHLCDVYSLFHYLRPRKRGKILSHMIADPETNISKLDIGLNKEVKREIKGDSTTNMFAVQSRQKFLLCAAGVFVSYFYYGILQESM